MAEFVTFTEDKFKNKTSYQNSKTLNLSFDRSHLTLNERLLRGWRASAKFNYRRIVIMPDYDSLVMDIELESKADWPNLNIGQVILLIDGETITLKPHENWHDCKISTQNGSVSKEYKESHFYEIDKDLLKRICDSKSFSMKIYGGQESDEIENVNAVVVYSKLFYNAVYDKTAYTDVVEKALKEFTRRDADISKFSNIALDGSGANGGCMGLLALLITMAGAAIGGICALF